MKTITQRTALFGPYALDLRSGELRKFGTKVKMGEQAFQILCMLLETPGEVVTRDELRAKLWANDTFVDFDHGLNSAVQRLRDCLSDSAAKPRWVETLPRRGYRFIHHVEWSDQGLAAEVSSQSRNGNGNGNQSTEAVALSRAQQPSEGKRWARTRVALLAAGTLVLLFAVAGITYRIRHPRFANRGTIVLGDFSNTTGDAVFDDTMKTALSVSFRQSPFFNVLSEVEVAKTLQLMTRPVGAKLTPEVTRELCLRAGGEAYLAGAIGSLGTEYVLGLKAINCQDGDTLAQDQVTAASKEKVLNALGRSVSKVRGELGESLASVHKFDVPLEQATTTSLEALKAHSLGRKVDRESGPIAATPYDLRAVEIDPNFAMGYLVLGGDYEDRGQRARASEYYRKAFRLREHASERERLRITGVYYDTVTGELDKSAETYRQEVESYPNDSFAYFSLAYVYCMQGLYEKAIAVSRQGIQRAPYTSHQLGPWTVFISALALQRFDEAAQVIRDLQARPGNEERIHALLYMLAIPRADSTALREQEAWLLGSPNFENWVLALESDTEAYEGRLQKSRESTKHAVEAAVRADSPETAGEWQAHSAQRVAAYGNLTEARQVATSALKFAPESRAVESEVALAAALAADTGRAESLVQDLAKRFPLDTQVQALWLPTIHAQLELNRRNPARAIDELRVASTLEYAGMPSDINTSCLYHVYIRGEAYLAAGQGSAAAAEFRKILDHKGIVWNCWTGALAHLGVARASALQARASQGADADAARARALVAYKDFLTLWKDADPEVPILKQAKAEYAKLQ